FGKPLAAGLTTWADHFRDAGYRTCYVGKWHNQGRPATWGYQTTRGLFGGGGGRWAVPTFDWNGKSVTGYRGWLFQSADRTYFPERGIGLTSDISTDFANASLKFLDTVGKQPFFLHVNFTAPHDPLLMPIGYEHIYDPKTLQLPANFRAQHAFDHGNFRGRDERLFDWPRTPQEVRRELAVYYSVITHMDGQIGRILDGLIRTGHRQDTLVLFASDHGLAIGSHGLRGKQNMYEHTIGVPLIISGPRVPSGKRIRGQCYLRDLFPTICQLAGVAPPESLDGKSLVPLFHRESPPIYREVFGYFRNAQRMIRGDRWKLITYPRINRVQLFDLAHDPDELSDLAADPTHQTTRMELLTRLRKWQASVGDPLLNR
ncbi:MAG: sulfatase-like hydrolase/transferase, partial [Planctomycetaceae bacterium]